MKKQGSAGIVVVIVLLLLMLLALIAIVSLQFTGLSITGGVISESGEVITEHYGVKDFDKIKLRGKGDIFLTQGEEYLLNIKANENVLRRLSVDVKDNTLIIKNRAFFSFTLDSIEIHVTMPEVKNIKVEGSGDILGQTKIQAENLNIFIAGSGDVNLNLNVEKLNTNIAGSGNANYVGFAREHIFSVSGSGDLHAFDLETRDSKVSISGSGDIEVFATKTLDIIISGSGDVYYKGNPTISQSISGSGDIKQR